MPQHARNGADPRRAPARKRKKKKLRRSSLLSFLIGTGILLLLFIPFWLGLANYIYVKNTPVEVVETYYTSLELRGPTGTTVTVLPAGADAPPTESSRLFETFRRMLADAVYTPGIPDTHTGHYQVTMRTNTGELVYTFHFSTVDGAAYYTDANGTNYRTVDGRAEAFLNSSYAYELYDQSTPPVLTSAATDTIIPSALSWSYQTKDGTFADLTQLSLTNEILTYPIANDIAFVFSLPPSTCRLTIRNGTRVVHTGEGVSSISLPSAELTQGNVLDFEIEAVYQQDSRFKYYGSAVYRFRMVVVEAAKFFLDGAGADASQAHTATEGDYFILSCQNVRNEQNLIISASPTPLATEPVIFKRGETVYAAIPATGVGQKRLTVTYGTVSSSFDLNITAKADAVHHDSITLRGDWEGALKGDLLGSYVSGKGAAADTAHPYKFTPDYAFLPPVAPAPTLAFGDTLTTGALQDASLPFELYAVPGTVCAMGGGYVLEAVENDTLLGNYVILDHGGGLYTWYCGLAQLFVTKGSPVAQGQALGTAGQTGLGIADTDCVLILATWGKTVFSPACLRTGHPVVILQ